MSGSAVRPPPAPPAGEPSPEIEKLSQDLGEAYEQLTLIYRTVRHLGASFDLEPIARQLVDRALEAASARAIQLHLRDGDGRLAVAASFGADGIMIDEAACERLARLERPTFFAADAAAKLLDPKSAARCDHVLAAPLEAGGRSLGLLVLVRDSNQRFTTVESKLVGALCNVTAVAVANWQYYRAILNEREMLDGVIREIGDGIVIADARWNARHTNPAARAFLGVADQHDGYDVLERLRGFELSVSEAELRGLVAVTQTTTPAGPEFLARCTDPRRPLVLACRVFHAHFGAAAEPILVLRLRDATREQREAEAQRDFMSLASHKLRTPLTKILGLLPIASDATAPGEIKLESFSGIEQGANELVSLIDGILEFVEYRRTEHRGVEVDLLPLAREAIAAVKARRTRGPDVRLFAEATTGPAQPVIGSPRMLRRLIENLIDNAMKFSPKDALPVEVTLGRTGPGGAAVITVRDHGEGMAPELLERVFRPFAQRDIDGTGQDAGAGLGLLLAREAALRHGGTLVVESHLGAGSLFRAEIPLRGFDEGGA